MFFFGLSLVFYNYQRLAKWENSVYSFIDEKDPIACMYVCQSRQFFRCPLWSLDQRLQI